MGSSGRCPYPWVFRDPSKPNHSSSLFYYPTCHFPTVEAAVSGQKAVVQIPQVTVKTSCARHCHCCLSHCIQSFSIFACPAQTWLQNALIPNLSWHIAVGLTSWLQQLCSRRAGTLELIPVQQQVGVCCQCCLQRNCRFYISRIGLPHSLLGKTLANTKQMKKPTVLPVQCLGSMQTGE